VEREKLQKDLGVTVKKSKNFSEWYTQVLKKAELADIRFNVKGFLAHMPWSVKAMKLMYRAFEDELEKRGHEPLMLPAVVPESNFEREKKHAEFKASVFWITEVGSERKKLEERLALRPTSETAFYQMYSLWVRSWRDLPMKRYQSCQVWRHETKATRPFIRGREFWWIEAHDAFATQEEAEAQVKEDAEITERVMYRLFGIPFLFFQRPEHDKFQGAVHTYAADTVMPDGKVLQLPSTHFLGQNFAKAFDIKFVDEEGKEKYVWQTCYGPAIWRILGTIVALHGDDKGLILPPEVAPIQAIVIPIFFKGKEQEVLKKARAIERKIVAGGMRAKVDERGEHTPGWKYNYWELKGTPLRVEIGPKDVEKGQVVLVRRDTGDKINVKDGELLKKISKLLDDIQSNLVRRADEFFKMRVSEAKNVGGLKNWLEKHGGLVKVNWCGEEECADFIKSETGGGEIKGTLFGKDEKPSGKCIRCGKKAKQVVYVGNTY
jgi:prolyl-tRNA synthetase